jgi:high frequency lysogenization protein
MQDTQNRSTRARTIALAGLLQAVYLVQQTGKGIFRDAADTRTCLESIFRTEAESAEAVFGGVPALHNGLELLGSQLGSDNSRRDMELTAYVITLMHLERKLARNRTMLNELGQGIVRIQGQADFFEDYNTAVIAALAELYQQTISTLAPRIMVRGEPVVLASPDSQQMIRALLLAGMRAAVLWRQCGGNRMRLIFGRKSLLACSRELLLEARQHA